MAWFLRLQSNLRNLPVKDTLTLLSSPHLGTQKTHLNRSDLTLCLAPRPPRLVLRFRRAGAIRVVRTHIKDENPSRILVGPLSTFGPQIWITLGVGRVAHRKKTDCLFASIAAGPPEIQHATVPLRICWCISRPSIVSSLGRTPSSYPRSKEASTGSWSHRERRLALKKC